MTRVGSTYLLPAALLTLLSGCVAAGVADQEEPDAGMAETKVFDPDPQATIQCGDTALSLGRGTAPNIMIVLDRSDSMNERKYLITGSTKWEQTTNALISTVTTVQSSVRWGLTFFPTSGSCEVAGVEVPIGNQQGDAIVTAISANSPDLDGLTPTSDAIRRATEALTQQSSGGRKYLLLATDGKPNGCTEDDEEELAIEAVREAARKGIHTFVIGVATRGSDADVVLDEMATEGLEPRSGSELRYYPADDQGGLTTALETISKQVTTCTFPLSGRPRYPDKVSVRIKDQLVPRDTSHQEGWDLNRDQRSIQLYGSQCMRVAGEGITKIHATFSCVGAPIR